MYFFECLIVNNDFVSWKFHSLSVRLQNYVFILYIYLLIFFNFLIRYSWDENLRHLVLALVVPTVLFGVSLGVLCYWYCPPMGKTCGGPGRNLIDKYARKEE